MGSKCILQCAIYRELKLGSAGDNVRTKEKRRQEVRHDPEWPPGIRTGEYMQGGRVLKADAVHGAVAAMSLVCEY